MSGLAERMFAAYNEQGPNPWKTWDGKDVPRWPDLNDQVRAKWEAAASVLEGAHPGRPGGFVTIDRDELAARILQDLLKDPHHTWEPEGYLATRAVTAATEFMFQLRLQRPPPPLVPVAGPSEDR